METKISVLYVDDEENNLISFKATFRLKYTVYTALNGSQALQLVKEKPIDIIITDQRMPQMTGVELLEEIIKINPEPMRILLTGYADMSAVVDAVNKGKIFHYLSKPWSEEELSSTIQRAYEIYAERKKITESFSQLEVTNEQLEFLLRQKLLS
ncbi:response regulator [Parapedobacter indicus]|uniref:Response regulator receiver domain-containing protein n=1 Tax=Parapedobacter indicus TaxID=1477437 RepID=A0A1I3MYX2_9SPHI|nr:response regulator [Parapedobacter indicus]PPL00823.1 response regulator receiver domain-containing protein [Parapedobacter indicus]SFJ02203.1 Response regulator receiver domain-containing protein [Parapedobacter indicus]